MKLIHITDTHFVGPGLTLYGLDPRARLDAAIDDINSTQADADLVVITGDLTHWGEEAAYRNLVECLSALTIPCVTLVGNHDKRTTCLDLVETAPRDPNGFVQGTQKTPQGTFLFLDTLDETSHAGQLCASRLGWIEETLAALPADEPIFLFMHHPPFPVGIHVMDQIALADGEAFGRVIEPYLPRIRHLFFGHVHRPICGSYRGIPFSTLRGTNHQVAFDLTKDGEHLMSHEPPAYGVVLIDKDQLVVHINDYLDESPRFPFRHETLDDKTYALGPMTV